jgi:eukaryotic-like serine/threonine-protein kinase
MAWAYLPPTGPSEEEVPEGQILAEKYRAERVLGAGGMGVVVRVRHIETSELFALKFLRPSTARDPSARARFLREAQAAGRIENPHVVRIPDVGTLASGVPYLVMEYLEGIPLEARLANGNCLPLAESCDLSLQACEGLAAAHATGVIHRDIKPANLFISYDEAGSELLKIVDFGVSKILDESMGQGITRTQTAIGSPLYMSPEQMRSARTADPRTDQWSLGAVLYRMVTGKLPFFAPSLPRLCVQVMEGAFVPMASVCPDLPAEFVAAVERCFRVQPNQRYADVAELAQALVPFAGPDGRARMENCRASLDRSS